MVQRAPQINRLRWLTALVVALLLFVAAMSAGLSAVVVSSQSTDCGQAATHDFRTDAAVETWNTSDRVVSADSNTEVVVEDSSAWIRLNATNPNGYCVATTVELPAEIVRPADLGTVDSVDESTAADWRAIKNFSTGVEHTEITVTVPAGDSVELAPSKARVVSLAWAQDSVDQAGGLLDSITSLVGDDEDQLDQREYRIDGNPGNRRTIPLESANTSAEVTDWLAEYRVDEGWQPVGRNLEAPVYYTTPNSDVIRLHYNTDAEVRWIANPTTWERASHQVSSYTAGWSSLSDLAKSLPFVD